MDLKTAIKNNNSKKVEELIDNKTVEEKINFIDTPINSSQDTPLNFAAIYNNIDIVKLICRLLNEAFQTQPALSQKYPQALQAMAGSSERLIQFVTDRPGHDRRYAIDAAKSQRELGYVPQESFETGIKKTVEWYLQNQNWWQSLC